jgi:carbon storage regulator
MLILTRKLNEEIIIDGEITIKIISISENQVKLGFDAPKNIEINRKEVFEKVKESLLKAAEMKKEIPNNLKGLKPNKL